VRLAALFTLAATVALGLQSGALHWLPTGVLIPDLILILAVDLGLKHHSAAAALTAFAMGLATDALSGSRVGLNAFTITLVFVLSYELSRHLWVTNEIVASVVVFVAVMIKDFGVLTLTGSFEGLRRPAATMLQMVLTQALLTALLSLLVFPLLDGCKRLLRLPARSDRE